MNYIEKYHENIRKYEAKQHIGYYPYKVIPLSNIAKIKFAKVIKAEVKDATYPFIWRFLDRSESEKTVKKYLNEENLKKSKFYGKANMFHIDASLAEKVFIRDNIATRISKEFGLHLDTDFKVEIDEFVSYPQVKEFGFEDLADLSGS